MQTTTNSKGAEKLQFKINGGLIAQEVFSSHNGGTLLNTEDLGPEIDFAVPRPWFPFNLIPFGRRKNPQTTLKFTFDYQLRLTYYIRNVFGASYALDWNLSKNKQLTIAPIEINLVNAALTPRFAQLLDQYNLFFQNSFQNQLITDIRGSFMWTTQDPNKRQNHFFILKPI